MSKFAILGSLALFFILPLWQPVMAATLSPTTKTPVVKVNQEFTVDINLSGNEATLGTDLVLLYEPQKLSALEVVAGSLYPTYNPSPAGRIRESEGKILLSGSGNVSQPVRAQGNFASIRFKAKATEKTFVRIDYEPEQTSKSGVIDFRGQDILKSAPAQLAITIQNPSIIDPLVSFIQSLLAKIGLITR